MINTVLVYQKVLPILIKLNAYVYPNKADNGCLLCISVQSLWLTCMKICRLLKKSSITLMLNKTVRPKNFTFS